MPKKLSRPKMPSLGDWVHVYFFDHATAHRTDKADNNSPVPTSALGMVSKVNETLTSKRGEFAGRFMNLCCWWQEPPGMPQDTVHIIMQDDIVSIEVLKRSKNEARRNRRPRRRNK